MMLQRPGAVSILAKRTASPLLVRALATASATKKKSFDPSVYLVTDDAYLTPEDGAGQTSPSTFGPPSLTQKILASCQGGATMVQLRLKNVSTKRYVDVARDVKNQMAAQGWAGRVPLIIDDRVDVALAIDADGCHVGDSDLDVPTVRKLVGPDKILGSSTYGDAEMMMAAIRDGADYVAGGGVAPSMTKKYVTKGVAHLHDIRYKLLANMGDIPLVAIGGITDFNASDITFAGADSLAIVSHILRHGSTGDVTAATKKIAELQNAAKIARRRAKDESSEVFGDLLADKRAEILKAGPLIHCMANYVSMDIMANVLLACGMSPAMVHNDKESGEFASVASAVAINIGTLNEESVRSFSDAANAANAKGTPWVLDPVAVGLLTYRTGVVQDLLKLKPTMIRGNPSEVVKCAELLGIDVSQASKGGEALVAKGCDSSLDTLSVNLEIVDELARRIEGTVVMTGAADYSTDGEKGYLALHSVPGLQHITAAGCSLTAVVSGFAAVEKATAAAAGMRPNYALAGAQACAYYTLSCQLAEKKALKQRLQAAGVGPGIDPAHDDVLAPGSLRVALLDGLAEISDSDIRALTRMERVF